ncbi:hypothetical protein CLAFUW4_10723 [Fulvia fulva]|nr:hypothetical protein CLAFUR4_10728 [Fulvia fulva]WPV19737.1 hypothetical protein CLAFUW4_10723 [Fulvia fulva]WPV33815.1 hypothetical protein CLAFUW7_10725 [Fulvia fulva]
MPSTTRSREHGLPRGNQQRMRELRTATYERGTESQQEDVGDLVEHIPDPTHTPQTARELREAMTDDEFDEAIAAAPTNQAKAYIDRIKRRDPGLLPDEELWYRWHKNRSLYYLLDLVTLRDIAKWVNDILYWKDTPAEQRKRALEKKGGRQTGEGDRAHARVERSSRAEGRRRSREMVDPTNRDRAEKEMAAIDQDELNPLKYSFGKSRSKRRKLSAEEYRWSSPAELEEKHTENKEDAFEDDEDPELLLEDNARAQDPIEALRQHYGYLLEVIYLDTVTAVEMSKLLEAFELAIPPASEKHRRDDLKEALLDAKEDDLLPDYVVLLPTDPTKAKEDPDLPPIDAEQRHVRSGVNYENGRMTRNPRMKTGGGEHTYA